MAALDYDTYIGLFEHSIQLLQQLWFHSHPIDHLGLDDEPDDLPGLAFGLSLLSPFCPSE